MKFRQILILTFLLIILTTAIIKGYDYEIRTTKVWTTQSQKYIADFENLRDIPIELKLKPVDPWVEVEASAGGRFDTIIQQILGIKTERRVIEQGTEIEVKIPAQTHWQLDFIIIYEHKRGDIYYQGEYLTGWYSKEAIQWFWSSLTIS